MEITMLATKNEQALEKIAKEIEKLEADVHVSGGTVLVPKKEQEGIIEYLKAKLEEKDDLAEKILQEDKTLKGALSYAANEIPKKLKDLKSVVVSDEVVFDWILEYFYKKEEKKQSKSAVRHSDPVSEEQMKEYARQAEEQRKKREAEEKAKKEAEYRKKHGVCEGQLNLFDLLGYQEEKTAEEEKQTMPEITPVTSNQDAASEILDEGLDRDEMDDELSDQEPITVEAEPASEQEIYQESETGFPFDVLPEEPQQEN